MPTSLYLISFLMTPSHPVNILKCVKYSFFHLPFKYCFKSTNGNNDSLEVMDIQKRTESGNIMHSCSSLSLLPFITLSSCAQARILRSNSGSDPPHPHPNPQIQLVWLALPPKQISNCGSYHLHGNHAGRNHHFSPGLLEYLLKGRAAS